MRSSLMPERWRVSKRGKNMCVGLMSGVFACVVRMCLVYAWCKCVRLLSDGGRWLMCPGCFTARLGHWTDWVDVL